MRAPAPPAPGVISTVPAAIRNVRAVQHEHRAGAGDPDEHAAERRAREPQRQRAHRAGPARWPGVSRSPREDLGHQRVEGRRVEGRADAVQRGEDHDVPDGQQAADLSPASRATASARSASAPDEQPAALQAVAGHAADQQEHDRRHGHRDADQRHPAGAARQRVDLPGQGDQERAVADQRDAVAPVHSRRKSRSAAGSGGRVRRARPGGPGPRGYGASPVAGADGEASAPDRCRKARAEVASIGWAK